ncbi:MAG: hypothetical protein V3T31_07225 [candidate division Zixibacteria bacterium]
MKIFLLLALLSFVVSGPVQSIEFANALSFGGGGAGRLNRPIASGLLDLPSSLTNRSWMFESGYSREYGLSEFDRFYIATAGRRGSFSAALGLAQFGSADFYAEQTIKVMVAYHYRKFMLSTLLSGMQVRFGSGYSKMSTQTAGFGAAFEHKYFITALSVDNINSPKLHPGAEPLEPNWRWQVQSLIWQSFSFTAGIKVTGTDDFRLLLAQDISLGTDNSFFWGINTRPLTYGGGVLLHVPSAALIYAVSNHPVLGLSHSISISLGNFKNRSRPKRGDDEFE